MVEINGSASDGRFEPLVEVLSSAIDRGDDLGASVAVTIEGESVVDVWGGWADEVKSTRWKEDTITNVWSTTKTMTSLAALVLVDRGELDVYKPVAHYWPEFGANGKGGIEVRHLMSHTSGVSGWDQPIQVEDIFDWQASTAKLAAQAPWWDPGAASGYHALNQGHLVGEVIRRVSGRPLKQFFREEIAEPLRADFQIGCDPADVPRVSDVVPPPPIPFDVDAMDPESPAVRTLTGPFVDASVASTEGWRASDIGAANGHGNARSVARVQAVVANGGALDGVRLLSQDTIDLIFDEQSDGVDLVIGIPLRFGIGYALAQPDTFPYIPPGRICFWGGWGGSMIIVDVERRMTIAYMMNKMGAGIIGNTTSEALIRSVYAALGVVLPATVI